MILDRIRFGSMIEPGQSLFILECEPAAYAEALLQDTGRALRFARCGFRWIVNTDSV